ncbi:MAG: hypothetical protein JW760_09620 [Spirochaetales bacterium]|nr:hypothetical protein [Spirochaetales bacterium]
MTDQANDQGAAGEIASCLYSLNGSTAETAFEPGADGSFSFSFSTADMVGTVTIKITAEDWNGKTSTVSLALNAPMSIVSYRFEASPVNNVLTEDAVGMFDGTDITVSMAGTTDITGLVATFEMTGVIIKVGEINQVSGQTPNNFTAPVQYTVTANNWDTRTYTVRVVNTPLAPTGLDAEASSWNRIDLIWNDVSIETGYEIQRKTGAAGTYANLPDNGANVVTLSDEGLLAATGYVYRVRAVNADGASPWSEEASATTSRFALQAVDLDVGSDGETRSSVAVDAAGNPHILYYSQGATPGIYYQYHDGTAWLTPPEHFTDPAPDTFLEGFSPMALDSSGRPHFVYYLEDSSNPENSWVKHAFRDSGSWQTGDIALTVSGLWAEPRAFALDGDDDPHFLYVQDDSTLHYTRYTGSAWDDTFPPLDLNAETLQEAAFALDDSGTPHVCYITTDYAGTDLSYLRYARWNSTGSSWDYEAAAELTQEDAQANLAMAFDPAGVLCLVMDDYLEEDWEKRGFILARWQNGWQNERVATTDNPRGASLAIDGAGTVHVAYRSGESPAFLAHGIKDAGGWHFEDDICTLGYQEDTISLVLDAGGRAHISFYGYFNGDTGLWYARDMSE